ncbi:MATE family efflux transporter [Halomarina oriensis]|uniref:Multidrug-efflux transporter n=1 Tax=Halomarina oriensis TaxID=671145 RepID=A0A6B0GJW4_9EURY|nr:MATE family efflux transporter [Halomarina oriensis]MWG34890.1 MATE family efflux transporter [Halomarina oriensis]
MAEQTFRTLMRTTDIVVTAAISPVAVAAIGLADLYARFPLWVGLGMGGGAIALSSQDTGAADAGDAGSDDGSEPGGDDPDRATSTVEETTTDATTRAAANRDQAISTAVVLGALLGVPFAAFGVLFGEQAIALVGAPADVARQGGQYLAIVFLTAPARHVSLVAARSLQGTGDTRTPMYVNVVANGLNITASAVLGLGLVGVQQYGIVGVGAATAAANVLTASALCLALLTSWSDANLVLPSDPVVFRQLVTVSAPSVAEGLLSTLAEFPFNAILLGFGTEVNAAFQVGRRVYQQVTSPLGRGYNVAVSVVVGQALGRDDAADARYLGWATTALGVCTVGVIGLVLAVFAPSLVWTFTDDPATARYAVDFARVYGLTAPFLVSFTVLQGALRGASETRVPLVARTTGMFGFMVGFTYLAGVVWDYGVLGAYAGLALSYVWMAFVVASSFHRGDWAGRATRMLADRGSTADDD